MAVAIAPSCWSLGYARQELISLTRCFYNPAIPRAKYFITQCTAGWLLGDKYALTTYHRLHPDVFVKLTTFGPKSAAPSTLHPSSSLHTMEIHTQCLTSASVAHNLYPKVYRVWIPPVRYLSCSTMILMLPCHSARSASSKPTPTTT